ncbi:unnamed protein product [Arabidopsis halleri]
MLPILESLWLGFSDESQIPEMAMHHLCQAIQGLQFELNRRVFCLPGFHLKSILDAFSNCYSSPNKNLQLAYSTLLLNYAVLSIEKKDQEGQAQVLSAALQVRCLES